MRKIIVFIVLLMMLLSGCSGAPTDTNNGDNSGKSTDNDNQVEEQKEGQNSNFNQFKDAPDDAIALLINLPTSDQRSLLKIQETLYLQDTEEKIIVIPRDAHASVELYTVDDISEAGDITASKFYTNEDCGKDFAMELQAIRPEGLPNYKLLIQLPNGTEKEYFISYNGKDGNPNLEYILK
ncbi:hypothetical protein [Clostridium aminobutyricum]|uniref:Lipoprotein n=1 Tax=Clostridium aminobutyricum TaxID=33953 RepID=A0A939IH48_CLOAM|nr:hypothetical protein [Clostridium aminobutyricum]MBN7773127.1 hypothetical protein [Clostridium aminobutyricum]